MVKIIDVLNKKIAAGEPFFSFEYFPPKTDEGVQNLRERQLRMAALGPAFCDITWGAGGSTADVTLDVARSMQQEVRVKPGQPSRHERGSLTLTSGACRILRGAAPGTALPVRCAATAAAASAPFCFLHMSALLSVPTLPVCPCPHVCTCICRSALRR